MNADGILQTNEPFTTTSLDDPATTDNDAGRFQFIGLVPGPYRVGVEIPGGYLPKSPLRERIISLDAANAPIVSSAAISANGRYVAYESTSSLFIPGQIDAQQRDVYRYDADLAVKKSFLISPGDPGLLRQVNSTTPSMSDNGSLVVYETEGQMFVTDGTLPRIALGAGSDPSITGNGSFVVYADVGIRRRDLSTSAVNLISGGGGSRREWDQ